MLIFRWSVWGSSSHLDVMLSHSIGTFRRFFGNRANYVVYTDNPEGVERALQVTAEVRDVRREDVCNFADPECTWRKWWPAARLDPNAIEFRVDADMFLLNEPAELWHFCADANDKLFVCTTEPFPVGYYGNFASILNSSLPPINTGLIGQQVGADLTVALSTEYQWWRKNVEPGGEEFHDEQGAVVKALESYILDGRVMLLPNDRYRVVCPLNDSLLTNLDGLVLLHATYPHHPAFWQFQREIAAVSGVPVVDGD